MRFSSSEYIADMRELVPLDLTFFSSRWHFFNQGIRGVPYYVYHLPEKHACEG